ncbi:MAG: hypothetical protein M3081_14930, partial [Gemmatimonadota bacterium]|nr:hypothetical protein [Gemmatimonadota bacterium]
MTTDTRSRADAASISPRLATSWAALTYALSALLLAYPALFGKFLVTPVSDQYIGGFPVRDFAAQSLKAGHGIPLWNPYLLGGLPYVAAMHGDIFYPTFLLRALLPTDVAMTWSFIIHFFLAGLFTYLFLRAYGFGFAGALIGGLAYMLGGPIAAYVSPGHDGKLYVSALFPMALLLLVRIIRDGRMWAYGVLALVIGLAVLSPHPQLLQYMLLCAGAFALYLAFLDPRAVALTARQRTIRLGGALAAIALGALMGAVQYLSVMEYVKWSPRAAGMKGGYDHATSYSFPPEELINTYLPQFSGILDHYWGRNNIHLHSEYIGVAVFFLAGLAFGGAALARRNRFIWFWTSAMIISLLWCLGGFTPFYAMVYAIVPGTKFFRAPSTMMFVFAFSIAILAAAGVERLLSGDFTKRYIFGWAIGGAAVLLLGVSGGLASMATGLASGWGADRFAEANASQITIGAVRSTLFLALMLGAALAIMRGAITRGQAFAAIGLILVADLWSIERLYWRFSEPASTLYASDPTIEYIKKQPEPGRELAVPLREPEAPRDPFLKYDAPMVHGIRLA